MSGIANSTVQVGEIELRYVTLNSVASELESSDKEITEEQKKFIQYAKSETDLVTEKYEGGLKIWEGALDLCEFLSKEYPDLTAKNVLETGCGAGLPGILTLKLRADSVSFQDYNQFVLSEVTERNVALNCPKESEKCQYIGGSWEETRNSLNKSRFDIILSSETIYSPASYASLHQLMAHSLAPHGFVLVASKSYYFGVGGSIAQWRAFVDSQGIFKTEEVWSSDSGVKRKILKHTRI